MKKDILASTAAASLLLLTACSGGLVVAEGPPSPGAPSTAATLGIPPGHLPPAGQCRIWHPGEPPGHQPEAGSCASLASRLPVGAWLVFNPGSDRGKGRGKAKGRKAARHLRVTVRRADAPDLLRYYDRQSLELVREEEK